MNKKHNKSKRKSDSSPCTKIMLLKRARRHLKKNHPDYKAQKAVYDTEFGVWFVYIGSTRLKKTGSIEYNYHGTFVRIELDAPVRSHVVNRAKVKSSYKPLLGPKEGYISIF